MAEIFNLQKAREICKKAPSDLEGRLWMGDDLCATVDALPVACDEIERLQKAISEPLEAFGTPELIAWSQELTRLLDVPESERGGWPFVLSVGCHLEKFAKSWNSQTMAEKDAEIERLRAENSRLDADILSACINRQAIEIDELKAKIDDDAIIANHKYLDLQYICTDQDKRIEALEAALDDLVSDLTQLLAEIDQMGHAGHHVELIRKKLDENPSLKKACDLLFKNVKTGGKQ